MTNSNRFYSRLIYFSRFHQVQKTADNMARVLSGKYAYFTTRYNTAVLSAQNFPDIYMSRKKYIFLAGFSIAFR